MTCPRFLNLWIALAMIPALAFAGGVGDQVDAAKSAGASFDRVSFFTTSTDLAAVDGDALWERHGALTDVLADASLARFDGRRAKTFLADTPSSFTLDLPYRGRTLQIELVESRLFTNDFVLSIDGTEIKADPGVVGRHFLGTLAGERSSYAAVSVYADQVMALLYSPSVGVLVAGPLGGQLAGPKDHVIYNREDLALEAEFGCALQTEAQVGNQVGDQSGDLTKQLLETPDWLKGLAVTHKAIGTIDMYYDSSSRILQQQGSQSAAVSWTTGLANQVRALYTNEQIPTAVSGVNVRTNDNWPTTPGSNFQNMFSWLSSFSNTSFNGDAAQALNIGSVSGLAGSIGGICGQPNGNLSGFADGTPGDNNYAISLITSSYQNVPTYSDSVRVPAHEWGHVLGSPHTHNCFWNGNGTAIDGCQTTEGSCSRPPASSNGTIMSYCSMTNFNNGFGTQPGNQLRSYLDAQTCLGGGGGGGGGECNPPGPNSCDGKCGQNAGNCWCDSQCAQFGDCCTDIQQACVDGGCGGGGGGDDPNSCAGNCGAQAPGGCYCDSQCAQFGDCCADKVQQCG